MRKLTKAEEDKLRVRKKEVQQQQESKPKAVVQEQKQEPQAAAPAPPAHLLRILAIAEKNMSTVASILKEVTKERPERKKKFICTIGRGSDGKAKEVSIEER
jgi:hypothetical protein